MRDSYQRCRILTFATIVAWAYPLLMVVSLYFTWLAAWVMLGHSPGPFRDDPTSISVWVTIPYYLFGLLLISIPSAFVSGLISTVWLASLCRTRFAPTLFALAVLMVIWAAAITVLRWDPFAIIEWYMD